MINLFDPVQIALMYRIYTDVARFTVGLRFAPLANDRGFRAGFLEVSVAAFVLTQVSNTWNDIIGHGKNRCSKTYYRSPAVHQRAIAETVGVHKTTVGNWITQYNKGGDEALKIGQRGRRTGEGRFLSEAQKTRLQEIVIGKCPDQLQLPFALWSSTAIRALIK